MTELWHSVWRTPALLLVACVLIILVGAWALISIFVGLVKG